LEERPELVNTSPYGAGWMIIIEVSQVEAWPDLLSAEDYQQYIAQAS
jgi:glycine cleavage system H protein